MLVDPPSKDPSRDPADESVIASFDIDPSAWNRGRIVYVCSLCASSGDAGPTRNPAVHEEMRQHLKRLHKMKGTSMLRSETLMDDHGAISAIRFFRP
jgi:hypothetical protein